MSETKTTYDKVDTWVDIPALERDILAFWKETRAFEVLREKNAGNEPYSFLDGPITANNPMGVHHAWGRTLKDAFQRYWAMNGRDLRYQNGFDCQGLWVEVEVEKEHGFKSKRDIEAYGVGNFVEECKARVRKYSAVQTEQSIRLGMWMDWSDSYYTMADENNYTIWSFLKKCFERDKIYRGKDVVPWSGRSGTAYSQMEIIEGRKLVAHISVFVRFPLLDKPGENLLVWTTTPWTLTSNVAAAVNVDLDYVKLRAKHDGEVYYFAQENLNFQRLEKQFAEKGSWVDGVPKLKTIAQMFDERGGYEIEGIVKGADLVGLRYRGPFDSLEAQNAVGGFPFEDENVTISAVQAHKVIDGGRDNIGNPIVVAGEGTGIVHIAPGCGDIDHKMGAALKIPAIAPLDDTASFIDGFGFLSGRSSTDHETVDLILDDLKNRNVLFAKERYPHVYPHCWRSGDELVFRLVDEWYINMDWRDEIIKVVGDVQWIPEWGHDREVEWLTNMRDWMISKKRYWGLALPIWVCEECDHFHVVGGKEELEELAIEGWDEFEGHSPHRPYVDAVKIACPECGAKAHRVEDVGNPWLDAGIVPYSTAKYRTDREYWKKWMPADLVLECFPGQFRNWFYSLLAMSTMMEGIAPFKRLLGHALVRDETGKEMHKSTGNAIWFDDAADEAGADVMRWLYTGQEPTTNLNFGFGPLRKVRGKFINTLWNTYAFYANYARLADFVPGDEPTPFAERPDFDRWILTELNRTTATCRTAIESYDMRTASRAIEAFLENLSNWYIRHNRRRFWKSGDTADTRAAFDTLFESVYGLIRLAAPMIPLITEAIYQNAVRAVQPGAPASLHHTDYPTVDEAQMDDVLADEMQAIIRLNSIALSARETKRVKVRQPLSVLTVGPADKLEASAAARFEAMLREDLNVKSVEILEPGTDSPLSYEIKANFKRLGPRLGKQMKAVAAAIGARGQELVAILKGGPGALEVVVAGETIELSRDELQLVALAPEDLAIAEDGGTWLSFDTRLTEDLEIEGIMRDVLRRLQMLRKDEELEIEDRIKLQWDTDSSKIEAVFAAWSSFMSEELLCTELTRTAGLDGKALKAAGHGLSVSIARA